MTVDELKILITANTRQLQQEINKANKNIAGLQKSADKSSKGFLSSFTALKRGIIALGIGKVIKDSITSGMNAIESDSLFETSLGGMADDVRAWSDDIAETLGLSATAIRKNTGVIYNMTTSMGVAQDNALKMSKGISVLTEDMASFYNLDSEEAFNKLRAGLTGETEPLKALGILVDENTIKQVAYQQGIAKTGSELTNQQKVLARYVAILQQTGNAQGDLARTIDSPANQLRILKNQVSNLGRAFGNLLLPMLQAVLPYITAFTKVVTIALNTLSSLLARVFGYELKESSSAVGGLADGFSDATSGVNGISNGLGGVNDGLDDANKKAKKLKGQLAGFDEMNVLQDNSTDDSSSGGAGAIGMGSGGAIGGVGADGLFSLGEYDAKLDGLTSKVDEIVEKMRSSFSSLGEFMRTTWDTVWNSEPMQAFVGALGTHAQSMYMWFTTMTTSLITNLQTTWSQIQTDVGIGVENLSLLWTQFWTDIDLGIQEWSPKILQGVDGLFNSVWKDAISPYIELMTKKWADFTGIVLDLWNEHGSRLINNIGEFITETVGLFQRIWDDVIEPILTPFLETVSWLWDKHIKGMVKEFGDFVGELVNGALEIWNKCLKPVIDNLIERLAPAWSFISSLVVGVMGTILGVVTDVITGVIKVFKGIVEFITGFFTGNWRKCWEGIKDIFGGVWDAIEGILKGVVNAIIDVLNSMIRGINKINFKVPDWVPVLGGEKVGLNVPTIPKLAKGGIVTSPTQAIIGEAGREAVLPLENNLGYLDELADKINSRGGNQPTQVIIKLGEETIFEKFIDYTQNKSFETNGEVFSL